METITILKIAFFAGGILMFLGLVYFEDRNNARTSLVISRILLILADILILGSLIGQYVLSGTDIIAVLMMFLLINYMIFRKKKKD